MPSADDFVPNFDHLDDLSSAPPSLEHAEPSFPPTTSKKKKKKDRKNVAVARPSRVDDDNDSSAYPKSISPSPPTDRGVRLQPNASTTPPPHSLLDDIPPSNIRFDDDATAVEDLEALPPTRLPPERAYPAVPSPRPTPAKPMPATTPPQRPVGLHGFPNRDRNGSLSTHRPAPPLPSQVQPRRESFASQTPARFVDPPPPHMPQAHFFGVPDLGLKLNQKQEAGLPAGSNGYCCRIDSLADAGDGISATKARDALLVGSEGGLEVFRILANKLEVVGRLEGLRGSVIGAKILPHTERFDDLQLFRPLVAVVQHGPMSDDPSGPSPAHESDKGGAEVASGRVQTTVDVYSLQTQHYIATLYSSTPSPVEPSNFGLSSSLPKPVGDLQVDASGQFIAISSGKSGEVFLFTQAPLNGSEETRFRCIGKFWTSVQKTQPVSRPASGSEGVGIIDTKEEPLLPLVNLSQRWLAIVPPMVSPNISIQGSPLLAEINPSPPGITTHTAPAQPLVTCEVVGADVEGTWSRLGRQAAQGLVKYSQKGIEMGLQGWKELTQPSPPGSRPNHDRSSSKDDLFPPTKGISDDPDRLKKEPALVSIIDLESLLMWEEHKPKYPPPPMATFALVDGCNFLSISSSGTRLLTSSRKGEISTVWDLKQVAHGLPKSDAVQDDDDASSSPCIRQLHRIARNSPSTVLDCAWSRDDENIAILTAHGTIHLHELPKHPPSRKRKRASHVGPPAPSAEKADATVSLSSGMSPPSANQGFLGSIKSSWQSVSTQVNSMRSTNPVSAFGLPTTFAGFRDATAAAGTAGSRAVAKGLSQGYTAAKGGASDYWHADDNKIRHSKALQEPFSARSLKWVRRHNTESVAITCGGNVHIHPVQHVTRRKGDEIISGLKHERYAHKSFALPPIATRADTRGVKADPCAGQGPHGFWSFRHSTSSIETERKAGLQPNAILQNYVNDVETNPPYCPFHVDSRINICAFDEDSSILGQSRSRTFQEFQNRGHGMPDEGAWTFGDPLPSSNKINDRSPEDLQDMGFADAEPDEDGDEDEEGIASQMESKLTIQPARRKDEGDQIRINTRRRQGKGHSGFAPNIDGDGGFDLLEEDGGMT